MRQHTWPGRQAAQASAGLCSMFVTDSCCKFLRSCPVLQIFKESTTRQESYLLSRHLCRQATCQPADLWPQQAEATQSCPRPTGSSTHGWRATVVLPELGPLADLVELSQLSRRLCLQGHLALVLLPGLQAGAHVDHLLLLGRGQAQVLHWGRARLPLLLGGLPALPLHGHTECC